jgi:hypothetical protein
MLNYSPLRAALAILILTASGPGYAQFKCDASTSSKWLHSPAGFKDGSVIPKSLIQVVDRHFAKASAMLDRRPYAALRADQVTQFVGDAAFSKRATSEFHPYLVRAVFPTPNSNLELRWVGDDLHVEAAGLGCAPFSNRPIVVFLNRRPASVFVIAAGAL